MRDAQRTIVEKLQEHPVIIAWSLIWLVVAILNFDAGRKVGGFPVAMAFVSFAMLGAYAASIYHSATGKRQVGLLVMICAQLALGQYAGWGSLGLHLSRGAAGLDVEAATHNTGSEQLDTAKRERAALGDPRAIDRIEAEEHLECESGIGPRCTRLRGELADARKASELDERIGALVGNLRSGPQLNDANAPFRVAQALGGMIASMLAGEPRAVTREDVIFWFSIFLTFALEFVGTCGPWLFGFHDKWTDPPRVRRRDDSAADGWDHGPRRIEFAAGARSALAPDAVRSEAGLDRHQHYFVTGGQPPVPETGAAPGSPRGSLGVPAAGDDGLYQPSQTSASTPHQHQHGAPITINFGASDFAPQSRPEAPGSAAAALQEHIADRNVASLRAVARRPLTAAVEETARDAPALPADRNHLQALLDSLVVFRAAELVNQKGAWSEAGQVYGRYAEWAAERACSAESFKTLFPAATGITLHDLGGIPHYAGIALKRRPQKEQVA